MVEHFCSVGHKEEEFSHTVLYVGKLKGKELQNELLRSEKYWIHCLGMTKPAGMNVSLDLSCYL